MSTQLSAWLTSVISGLSHEIYGPEIWAETLGVSRELIDDWMSGRATPAADDLDKILTVLEMGYPKKAGPQLTEFAGIAARPIAETAPGISCEERTLDEYRTSAFYERLRVSLSPLSAAEKREILQEAIWDANEKVVDRTRRRG